METFEISSYKVSSPPPPPPPHPQEKRNFLLSEEYRYLTTSAVNAFFWSF